VPSQVTFNQPLFWDTKSATDMSSMFFRAKAFNQPLPWNTKRATDMSYMFYRATSFNQDISSWSTSNVVSFLGILQHADAFNQDISSWSVGASCQFSDAFHAAASFNQNLNPWEQQLVGKNCNGGAPDVSFMFYDSGCPVQDATIPGDFCQVAPSAMPSGRQTKKPTKPPARAPTGAFHVRVCLAKAVKHCSCKKTTKRQQCSNALTTACKAKYVAAGGTVNKFIRLAKAAARRRKCDR
jgi:hypothetical protein